MTDAKRFFDLLLVVPALVLLLPFLALIAAHRTAENWCPGLFRPDSSRYTRQAFPDLQVSDNDQ